MSGIIPPVAGRTLAGLVDIMVVIQNALVARYVSVGLMQVGAYLILRSSIACPGPSTRQRGSGEGWAPMTLRGSFSKGFARFRLRACVEPAFEFHLSPGHSMRFLFFVMRRDAGTSRRSPARSSLTFRSVTPMPDASSWASLARPCPRPLRTSVLFGKYCDSFAPFVDDVGPCIYLNSRMFLALLSHLLCVVFRIAIAALARRERVRLESPFTTRDPPSIELSPTL